MLVSLNKASRIINLWLKEKESEHRADEGGGWIVVHELRSDKCFDRCVNDNRLSMLVGLQLVSPTPYFILPFSLVARTPC